MMIMATIMMSMQSNAFSEFGPMPTTWNKLPLDFFCVLLLQESAYIS